MKIKILVLSAILTFLGAYTACYAAELPQKPDVEIQRAAGGLIPQSAQTDCECERPPRMTKEEMQAKKAEIDKRLNLTEKQKKQLEENRKKDREKMKPLMEKMKANREALEKIRDDNTLTDVEKFNKSKELRLEKAELKLEADKLHKENLEKLKSVLTKEQNREFEKIRFEQKQQFEQMKTMKKDCCDRPLPVPPVKSEK